VVDTDVVMARMIEDLAGSALVCDSMDIDSPLLVALDFLKACNESVDSVHLLEGVNSYIGLPQLFGRPVMFYGWRHRIQAVKELIAQSAGSSLEECLLGKLAVLHNGTLDAFLLELPFDSLDWSAWTGRKLTWQDGRAIAIECYLPSLVHDLSNLSRRLDSEQVDKPDLLVDHVRSILGRLETYGHFLCDAEKKLLDSALFPTEGEKWSAAVVATDVGPAIEALRSICVSIQSETGQ
jgi:hypothetical protein